MTDLSFKVSQYCIITSLIGLMMKLLHEFMQCFLQICVLVLLRRGLVVIFILLLYIRWTSFLSPTLTIVWVIASLIASVVLIPALSWLVGHVT
jgi:hypothetical protein